MSKHTPGPWHVVPDSLGGVEAENGTAVCQAFMTKQPRKAEDHEERRSNARLIAAAPEGLDAAMLAYEILADIRHQWKGRETPGGQIALVCLRDFIAKATGRDAQEVQDDFTNRRIAA